VLLDPPFRGGTLEKMPARRGKEGCPRRHRPLPEGV